MLFLSFVKTIVMRLAIWCQLYNLKSVKNTHGGVLLLVIKSDTPPWVFFTIFKSHKWYQIAQRISYATRHTFDPFRNSRIIWRTNLV